VCGLLNVPADIYVASQYLPSVLWRLERCLLGLELSSVLGLSIDCPERMEHFLPSLMAVNAEPNLADNYERLEFLGAIRATRRCRFVFQRWFSS
jgi:hypothetical protein